MTRNIALRPLLLACVTAVALGACTPMVDTRGNLPDDDKLALIKPGRQNREDISSMLGTPSNTSSFGDETWYYISSRTETFAFFAPEEVDRKVVAIEFDPRGIVRQVKTYGLQDGKQVEMVDRETPTAGKELSVLEQLLGNVGRFSKEGPAGRAAGR